MSYPPGHRRRMSKRRLKFFPLSQDVMFVLVPSEVRYSVEILQQRKKVLKGLARWLTPCFHLFVMPNQPSPDKAMLAIRLPRALKARLQKKARALGMSFSDYVVWVLTRESNDVELSPNDYRKIAKEVEEARSGRRTDHRVRPAGPSPEA